MKLLCLYDGNDKQIIGESLQSISQEVVETHIYDFKVYCKILWYYSLLYCLNSCEVH